jgi:site-specific DNA recombinase
VGQDPHDQLLLHIRSAVAEYEHTLIAERMRRGRLRKLRAGVLLPWTRAPYGYRLDPERPRDPAGVRVEEAEAAGVRERFAQYLEPGGSLAGVAKRLFALGVPTPTGKRCWHANTVRLLLTNPAYPVRSMSDAAAPGQPRRAGPRCARRTGSLWCRSRPWSARSSSSKCRPNWPRTSSLRALVSCGVCPLGCVGRCVHPGYAYYLYRGKAHPIQSGRERRCPARFIPAAQLDALVWADLCDVLTHPASLAHALKRAHAGHWLPQEFQARREHLRRGR